MRRDTGSDALWATFLGAGSKGPRRTSGARDRVQTNVVELADSIRSQATAPLIVCQCLDDTSGGKAAWLWVFHENAKHRLEQLWAGLLNLSEVDEITNLLRGEGGLWLGAIDTYHLPPSKWFRLVWTLPPAPCRIYTRRGMKCDVERSQVRVRGLWRTRELTLSGIERVEGWITWSRSGIRLKLERSESNDAELIRTGHPGAWLVNYDGIDLMVDTCWLDSLVPRVAKVLDVGWSIVDHTESPPAVRNSEPVGDGEPERPTPPANPTGLRFALMRREVETRMRLGDEIFCNLHRDRPSRMSRSARMKVQTNQRLPSTLSKRAGGAGRQECAA